MSLNDYSEIESTKNKKDINMNWRLQEENQIKEEMMIDQLNQYSNMKKIKKYEKTKKKE